MRIANWKKYQHYKGRRPEWIKVYNSLLQNYDYAKLSDTSKLVLFTFYLIGSRTMDGMIPFDLQYIRSQGAISADVTIDHIQELANQGFLELTEDEKMLLAKCYQSASTLLADCNSYAIDVQSTRNNGQKNGSENTDILPAETEKAGGFSEDKDRHYNEKTVINQRNEQNASKTLASCKQSACLEIEIEKERKDISVKTANAISTVVFFPEDFLTFWKNYPQAMRKEKKNALKAWRSAVKQASAEEILACLESAKRGWSQKEGFVPSPPYPAKWLKNAPWLDSMPEQRELELGLPAQTEVPGQPLWSAVRRDIEQHVGPGVFAGLISSLKCSISENIVVLQTTNKFQQQHITQQYGSLIKNLFSKHDQKIVWGGIKYEK